MKYTLSTLYKDLYDNRKNYDYCQELYNKYFLDVLKAEGFNEKQAGLIAYKSWEDGHSSGYSEVISYAREYVDFIKNFKEYEKEQ